MADQKVTFVLDGEEAGIVQAWKNARASVETYEKGLSGVDNAQRKNAKAAAEWDRIAMKTLRDIATPQERHNKRLAEMSELLNRGKLNQDQFAKSIRRSHAEMLKEIKPETGGIANLTAVVGGVAGAFSTAVAVGRGYLDFTAELNREAEEAGKKQDELLKKLRAVAGFTASQGKEAQDSTLNVANKRAVDFEPAQATVEELSSSGFSGKEASGSALDATLKFSNAQVKADPKAIAAAASQWLAANGKELTGENIEETGIKFQSQKDTKLTVRDFGRVADSTPALRSAGVKEDEIIAAAGVLSRGKNVPQAMTEFQAVAQNLGSARNTPDRVEALKKLKLKPQDVDMVGESFNDVIGLLKERLAKLPEDQAKAIKDRLVEKTNAGTLTQLMDNHGELVNRTQNILSPEAREQYEKDAAVFETGRSALETRQRNEKFRKDSLGDKQGDLWRAELDLQAQEQGKSNPQRFVQSKMYDTANWLTSNPRLSASMALLASNPFQVIEQGMSGFPEAKASMDDLDFRLAEKSGMPGPVGVAQRMLDDLKRQEELKRENSRPSALVRSMGIVDPENQIVPADPAKPFISKGFRPPRPKGSRIVEQAGEPAVEVLRGPDDTARGKMLLNQTPKDVRETFPLTKPLPSDQPNQSGRVIERINGQASDNIERGRKFLNQTPNNLRETSSAVKTLALPAKEEPMARQPDRVIERVADRSSAPAPNEFTTALKMNTAAVVKNNELMANQNRQPPVNMKPNTTPAAPVNSAANGKPSNLRP